MRQKKNLMNLITEKVQKNNIYFIYLFSIIILLFFSCKIPKVKYFKVVNGVIPYEATELIILNNYKDTLYSANRPLKTKGRIFEKYTGEYYRISRGNGNIIFKCKITKGVFNGDFWRYYSNGNLMKKGYLENGKYHGLITSFYPTGAVKEIVNYCNGKKVGLCKFYDDEGNLLKEENNGTVPTNCQ